MARGAHAAPGRPGRAPGVERLFFALWPDRPTRARLARAGAATARACGTHPVPAANLHLTLAFLGDTPADIAARAREAAAAMRFEPFAFDIDHAGWWKHNAIAWLGCRETPAPLAALAHRIQAELRARGVAFDAHPRFVPHVTVARRANAPSGGEPGFEPIRWTVGEFVLLRSEPRADGRAYAVAGRWGG